MLATTAAQVGYASMTRSILLRRLAIPAAMALVATCPAGCLAADTDAHDLYEAASMMHTHLVAASFMVTRCGATWPNSKARLDASFATWRSADAKAIEAAELVWQEMETSSPRTASEKQDDQRELAHLWSLMARRDKSDPPDIGERRCLAYASKLASEDGRRRSPNMYRLLER